MKLSKAIQGYFYDKAATYSPNTLETYKHVHKTLLEHIGDVDIAKITPKDLTSFIRWLQTDYTPNRSDGDTSPLSPAYIDIHWKAVRSFFGWAEKVLELPRPDGDMPRPRFRRDQPKAFSEDEIRRLLKSANEIKARSRAGNEYTHRSPTGERNKAVILTLLDTGVRIGELTRIKMKDIDFESGEIMISPYSTGKKTRPRIVLLGKAARRAIWIYVARKETIHKDDLLFGMTPSGIRNMLTRLAKRADVDHVHAHKFRHTFAIEYLRNGGDVFTLQRLLGHSSLEMVRNYLDIAKADIHTAHRKSSPVDNWNKGSSL
jgi:integrase/recombinase XerD